MGSEGRRKDDFGCPRCSEKRISWGEARLWRHSCAQALLHSYYHQSGTLFYALIQTRIISRWRMFNRRATGESASESAWRFPTKMQRCNRKGQRSRVFQESCLLFSRRHATNAKHAPRCGIGRGPFLHRRSERHGNFSSVHTRRSSWHSGDRQVNFTLLRIRTPGNALWRRRWTLAVHTPSPLCGDFGLLAADVVLHRLTYARGPSNGPHWSARWL